MTGGTRSFRRPQRVVAIALALLMLQGAVDAYHLVRDDGGVLGPRVAFSGSTERHVAAPGDRRGESDPHCAICHWLQLLATSQIAHGFVGAPPAARLLRLGHLRLSAPRVALAQSPARAPPASVALS
ncbi:MAG TPA: hypothetical protein VNE16_16050 [Vicinamibacterales bacterium]|nr:hypothetical protein [Vicinamibacterales bacterium]